MKPRYKIRFVTKETKNKQESEKKNESKTYMGQSRIWALEGSILR